MTLTPKGNAPELMRVLPKMPNKDQSWHCFKSPADVASYVASRKESDFWNRQCLTPSDEFHGPKMPDAIQMCRAGWQEGATRVARLRDKIAPRIPVQKRYTQFAVAGAIPDVARTIAGNPLNMKRLGTVKARQRPVLTLVNHMGGLAQIEAPTFTNKCAVVAAVVDAIEASGYSCHVIGLSMSQTEKFLCGVAVNVKSPGETVDTARLAFALGHVAMFRRLVFAVRASHPDNKPLTSTLGGTVDFSESLPNVFVLPSMNKNAKLFETEEKAATEGLAYYLEELRKQGCPAFMESLAA